MAHNQIWHYLSPSKSQFYQNPILNYETFFFFREQPWFYINITEALISQMNNSNTKALTHPCNGDQAKIKTISFFANPKKKNLSFLTMQQLEPSLLNKRDVNSVKIDIQKKGLLRTSIY